MRRQILRSILLLVLTVGGSPAMALDPEICEERLKSVDERIASGKYPELNVQMAQISRDGIMQSCSILDEAMLDEMLAGFEFTLPTNSEDVREAHERAEFMERQAEQAAQSAELDEQRAEKDKAIRQARAAQKPPVPVVLKRPPTGKSTMGQLVARDDAMQDLDIHDWDYFNGNVRVLYETNPATNKENLPGAKRNYYVVEVDDSGNRTRHYVRELPIGEFAVVALRPGHDELVFQLRPGSLSGPKSTLERWSISKGERLSSVEAPELPWIEPHHQWSDSNYFRLTTNDGDVIFVGHRAVSKGERSPIWWLIASPDGRVVGKGVIHSDTETIVSNHSFRSRDGGAVLVTDFNNLGDERGIESQLETPFVYNFSGVEIKGTVGFETRLMTIDSNGEVTGQTAALYRQMEWFGLDKVKQVASAEDLQKAMSMAYNPARYGEDYSVRSYAVHGGNAAAIATVGGGYGVLLSASVLGAEQLSGIGDWFVDYSTDGNVRKTLIEPASDHLSAYFRLATGSDNDTVYLFASGNETRSYVMQLDANREFVAYAELSMSDKTEPKGMLADRRGVWVIGKKHGAGRVQSVWLARVDFD